MSEHDQHDQHEQQDQHGGHVDVETLADWQEGLLPAAEDLAVRGHLAGCVTCAARRDALGALPARLAAAADAGEAGAVPDDVATRLDRVLTDAQVPALPVRERGPRGMRLLQAAAVVVLLLAGVGFVASVLQVGGGADDATTAGGGGTNDSAGKGAESAGFPVTASGRNWAPDTVVAAIPDLVGGRLGPPVTGDTDGAQGAPSTLREAPGDTARLASGAPLAECVGALNDGPVTPVAVDLASWQGTPAVVIVLPTPQDPATVDAWVVGPDCAQADAHVLYFARAARP